MGPKSVGDGERELTKSHGHIHEHTELITHDAAVQIADSPGAVRHATDAVIDFLAGCAGGTASVYVGQSLDTVKVKMQTFPTEYKNAFDCFLKTYRNEGIYRGLYAGTVPSLAANISENAVLFMAYGMCQKGVAKLTGKNNVSDLSVIENAISGFSAAFFSSFTLCPTELIKCKLQAMREMRSSGKMSAAEMAATANIGPFGLTKQILREEGIRGIFRGLVPTFAREMPGYFFFFGGYELARHLMTPKGKTKDDIGAVKTIIAGGLGGVALWTAIFPADVIKSRVQVQANANLVDGKRLGFVPILFHVARTEGILALYNGLLPTVVRTFPATGALFLAVETTKKIGAKLTYGDNGDD